MDFIWYKIFNYADFMATDLVSRTYTKILEGIGQKDVLVTRGELVSIKYEGYFLPINLNGKNPFIKLGETESEKAYAVYKDENDDVYLGIEYEN